MTVWCATEPINANDVGRFFHPRRGTHTLFTPFSCKYGDLWPSDDNYVLRRWTKSEWIEQGITAERAFNLPWSEITYPDEWEP